MITGVVTADREAVVRVLVQGPTGVEREINGAIDTGFDGYLSLPPSLISVLDLPWRQRGRALLADGSESVFDLYEAVVVWDGLERRIPVDEAQTAPLIGMSLLTGCELIIQVWPGGSVTISAIQS